VSTDFTIRRGDDEIFDVDVRKENGDPLDDEDESGLTGGLHDFEGLWFTAKHNIKDADDDAVFQKTLGGGIVIDDEDSSKAVITVMAADTADLPDYQTRLRWDLQSKDGEGLVKTLASGVLIVEPDVTRGSAES
jgi:hypothetical protein